MSASCAAARVVPREGRRSTALAPNAIARCPTNIAPSAARSGRARSDLLAEQPAVALSLGGEPARAQGLDDGGGRHAWVVGVPVVLREPGGGGAARALSGHEGHQPLQVDPRQ